MLELARLASRIAHQLPEIIVIGYLQVVNKRIPMREP
jgi:hypothetical protein